MKLDGRLAVSLMMLAIFLLFVGQALLFSPEARAMPLLVGLPAIVLCILQIVLDLRKQSRQAVKTALVALEDRPLIAWLAVFFLGIVAFGFTYAAPPLVAAYLYFAARERPLVALAGGAFCLFVLLLIFEKLLNVQLFEGLVTPLLI
jgi:hypothetical protein